MEIFRIRLVKLRKNKRCSVDDFKLGSLKSIFSLIVFVNFIELNKYYLCTFLLCLRPVCVKKHSVAQVFVYFSTLKQNYLFIS